MPWTPQNAHKHKKGLTDKQARKWSYVANSVLEKTGSESRAVRAANSQTKRAGNAPNSGAIERRLKRRRSNS